MAHSIREIIPTRVATKEVLIFPAFCIFFFWIAVFRIVYRLG